VPKAKTPSPSGVSAKTAPSAYAYTLALAQKQQSTLLYESSSHFWLKLSAWSAATFCYFYAGFNYYTVLLYPPADLAWWVPHAFGVICLAMGAMGSWALMGSSNIIKTIRAVPVSRLATTPAAPRTTPIQLEIAVKRTIPFMRAKVITVAPEELTLQSRLWRPTATMTPQQREAAKRHEKQAQAAQWEQDQKRLMTLPFRHAGRGMKTAWRGLSRALTKEGFVRLNKGNTKYKIDVETGWALEDGRALERLIKIED
jgi:hypothetical protein